MLSGFIFWFAHVSHEKYTIGIINCSPVISYTIYFIIVPLHIRFPLPEIAILHSSSNKLLFLSYVYYAILTFYWLSLIFLKQSKFMENF